MAFVHRVGRTGRNGLSGTAITLYQPSDDSDIRELEKLGIKFVPKTLKDGEFQDTHDRDRRVNREKSREKLDIEMIGLVKKKKKKSNQATRRKSNGSLMKNARKKNGLKPVPRAVPNARPRSRVFKTTATLGWLFL